MSNWTRQSLISFPHFCSFSPFFKTVLLSLLLFVSPPLSLCLVKLDNNPDLSTYSNFPSLMLLFYLKIKFHFPFSRSRASCKKKHKIVYSVIVVNTDLSICNLSSAATALYLLCYFRPLCLLSFSFLQHDLWRLYEAV